MKGPGIIKHIDINMRMKCFIDISQTIDKLLNGGLYDIISNLLNFSKQSKELGTSWKQGVPVEVIPSAYRPVQLKLESMLGGHANLRMAVKKCVCYTIIIQNKPYDNKTFEYSYLKILQSKHYIFDSVL